MIRRKKGMLTFLCSLLPGAGEMYMGFLKQGSSIMLGFFLLIALAGFLNIGPVVYFVPVIWFYSFFHVHAMLAMSEEEFYAMEDNYIFSENYNIQKQFGDKNQAKKIVAVICIVLGAFGLWNIMLEILYSTIPVFGESVRVVINMLRIVPEILFAICLIGVGIHLIKGKKKELNEQTLLEDKLSEGQQKTTESWEESK